MTLIGRSKAELQENARTLAGSYELVFHQGDLYVPVHYETGAAQQSSLDTTMWVPVDLESVREMTRGMGILFQNPQEENNFVFMLEQLARPVRTVSPELMVKTETGLKLLSSTGVLVETDKTFRPNTLAPRLNTDPAKKQHVYDVFVEWLDSEEEADSLLHHLATALAPGWSAVKYVLLLGEGRNGKGVLLEMLQNVFGRDNVSSVTRQEIAALSPVVTALNNKLLNLVFDGAMEYVKDSGPEKTFIAGESGMVRKLYRSESTRVQTNALFVEALNREPKSRDKSSALQKRLARFWFPKVYPLNHKFRREMLSEEMLGAFLALLIDYYVQEDEVAEKLAPTKGAHQMQLDQMWVNSPVLQFLEHLYKSDPRSLSDAKIVGQQADPMLDAFLAWQSSQGFKEFSAADALILFRDYFEINRKSFRINGAPSTRKAFKEILPVTRDFIAHLKGQATDKETEDEAKLLSDEMVGD